MKPIVFLIYNNVIILITLVAMFNSYYFALLSVLLILGEGRPITANSDIYIYIYIYIYMCISLRYICASSLLVLLVNILNLD